MIYHVKNLHSLLHSYSLVYSLSRSPYQRSPLLNKCRLGLSRLHMCDEANPGSHHVTLPPLPSCRQQSRRCSYVPLISFIPCVLSHPHHTITAALRQLPVGRQSYHESVLTSCYCRHLACKVSQRRSFTCHFATCHVLCVRTPYHFSPCITRKGGY